VESFISNLLLLFLSILCMAFLFFPGRSILLLSRLIFINLKNPINLKEEELYRDLQMTPKDYQKRHKFLTASIRLLGLAWIAFIIYIVYMWKIA